MCELAAPLSRSRSALLRMERIEAMSAQIAVLESQRRLELSALACEDTPFGVRDHVADEVALALAESCGTARRLPAGGCAARPPTCVLSTAPPTRCRLGWRGSSRPAT